MKNAALIFRFLVDASARGERTALVTLTDVIGRSSRARGTQMAVSETGAFMGSFSGGCVEAAVVGEAKRVVASGIAETLRLGDGSPFIDIKLPCGGGIDLLIAPSPPVALINDACRSLADRDAIALSLGRDGSSNLRPATKLDRNEWRDGIFQVVHNPTLRLLIVGHGEETRALAVLGSAYGAEVVVLSPDLMLVESLAGSGGEAHHLKTPNHSPFLKTDHYTAVVFLFHDHEWEQALLGQALQQDSFFIGAMGSLATQTLRVAALIGTGVSQKSIERLIGPIGLVPATRDPETLALSALAQIAMHYDQACNPLLG